MAQFANVVPLTELDAANAVLSAAGLSPIDSQELDTPSTDDVQMVVNVFRRSLTEALTRGWRFNWRTGLQLTPAGTFDWNDGSATTTLNVYKAPVGALRWALTQCAENEQVEAVEGLSFRYTEGTPAVRALILLDPVRNRDGFDAQRYPQLFVDAAVACDFEQTPSVFRAYVTAKAAVRFVADTVSTDPRPALQQAEAQAWSDLVREQGVRYRHASIFNDAAAQRMLGYRQAPQGALARTYRQF